VFLTHLSGPPTGQQSAIEGVNDQDLTSQSPAAIYARMEWFDALALAALLTALGKFMSGLADLLKTFKKILRVAFSATF
jgi:hypothetical protein